MQGCALFGNPGKLRRDDEHIGYRQQQKVMISDFETLFKTHIARLDALEPTSTKQGPDGENAGGREALCPATGLALRQQSSTEVTAAATGLKAAEHVERALKSLQAESPAPIPSARRPLLGLESENSQATGASACSKSSHSTITKSSAGHLETGHPFVPPDDGPPSDHLHIHPRPPFVLGPENPSLKFVITNTSSRHMLHRVRVTNGPNSSFNVQDWSTTNLAPGISKTYTVVAGEEARAGDRGVLGELILKESTWGERSIPVLWCPDVLKNVPFARVLKVPATIPGGRSRLILPLNISSTVTVVPEEKRKPSKPFEPSSYPSGTGATPAAPIFTLHRYPRCHVAFAPRREGCFEQTYEWRGWRFQVVGECKVPDVRITSGVKTWTNDGVGVVRSRDVLRLDNHGPIRIPFRFVSPDLEEQDQSNLNGILKPGQDNQVLVPSVSQVTLVQAFTRFDVAGQKPLFSLWIVPGRTTNTGAQPSETLCDALILRMNDVTPFTGSVAIHFPSDTQVIPYLTLPLPSTTMPAWSVIRIKAPVRKWHAFTIPIIPSQASPSQPRQESRRVYRRFRSDAKVFTILVMEEGQESGDVRALVYSMCPLSEVPLRYGRARLILSAE